MVLFLYPMGRKMAEEELKRVGLTNHDGEAPRLLCKRRDPERSHVTVWVFDNRGISIQEWRDKQSRIETALDITIANIKHEKGKRRILLYAVPAKGDLPDFITWKDKYLSPDEFVLTLGESIMEPVTVDLANTPHVLWVVPPARKECIAKTAADAIAAQRGNGVYLRLQGRRGLPEGLARAMSDVL